jgi:osmotically-inducible protein OsmY
MPRQEEILRDVRAAFEHEERIDLFRYPIQLAYSDGILTLNGEVEHIVAKKLCLALAAAVPGVDGLVDRLRVMPTLGMGDGTIRDCVRDALFQEPTFTPCAIKVRDRGRVQTVQPAAWEPSGVIEVAVDGGVVTLAGEVPRLSHKRLAGVLAWWVPGSRDVVNALAVEPPEEDNDDGITEAVHLVLVKDPFLKAGHIHVWTKDRVVTLEGFVPNASISEIAEFDAWYVFGVNGVVNWLTVREYVEPLPDGELHVELRDGDEAVPDGPDQGINSTDSRMLMGRDRLYA